MEDALTESEREQLRRMSVLQRIAGVILARWGWRLTVFFVLSFAAFAVAVVWHGAVSAHRFDAKTKLLYNPHQAAKVDNMSDKQLYSILDRPSIKRRVGKILEMPDVDRECLVVDLQIKQERKPSNLFTLTAHASTWVGAVKKVNAYAQALIDEYVAYRTANLAAWRDSLSVRKRHILEQIATLEGEESSLKGRAGVVSPVDTLTMLNALLSDQRRNLSMLGVKIGNEEMRSRKLSEKVGSDGVAIAANGHAIRQKVSEIAGIDKEISALREKYTDMNPRVIGKLEEREAKEKSFSEFLAEKGISHVDIGAMDGIEKASQELIESEIKLEVLRENSRTLEAEIAQNERKSAELTMVVPVFERLRVKRSDLEQTLRDLDDQLEQMDYLEMSMSNDLKQIERAGGAGDNQPISLKNMIIAIVAALFATGVVAVWILALEFIFGRVDGAKELAAYDDIICLGSLPEKGAMSDDEAKDVFGVVALQFVNADVPKRIVLVCRLDGAGVETEFNDVLDWSIAMSGSRAFSLEVVGAAKFEPPTGAVAAGAEGLLNTFHDGAKGYFPVANRYALAPAELEMLRSDLASLGKEFDCIFLSVPDGLRRGGSFFDQLLGVCDSVLAFVAARKTLRSEFSYARNHITAATKPTMAIATGVCAKVAKKGMEADV